MQTVLPERGIAIDEALILLAQLSGRKDRLSSLASRQPQERLGNRYFGSSSGPIEYRYANYDVVQAEADYRAVADEIASLASRQPQERLGNRYFGSSSGPIEYRYANYDVVQAEADYRAVADEIAALQLELDLVNQTEVFSVEL